MILSRFGRRPGRGDLRRGVYWGAPGGDFRLSFVPNQRFSHFRLVEKIGEGAIGVVGKHDYNDLLCSVSRRSCAD